MEKHIWRLFTGPDGITNAGVASLPEEEHHYAYHVLRLVTGDDVDLCDGQGTLVRGRFARLDKRDARVEWAGPPRHEPEPWPVTAYVGVPKGAALEETLERTAELGLARLVFVRVAKSASRPPPKLEKLRRQAREALRVSKKTWATRVEWEDDFDSLMARLESEKESRGMGIHLLCDETPLAGLLGSSSPDGANAWPHFLHVLSQQAELLARRAPINFHVGPEASFTDEEREKLRRRVGAIGVSLGSAILRVPAATALAASLALSWVEAFPGGSQGAG